MLRQSIQFVRKLCGVREGTPESDRDKLTCLRGEDGQEVVEFAIAAGLVATFIFGIMEMCLVLFTWNSVAEAARETSRWASVRGITSSVTTSGVTSCANPNITTCPALATDIQNYAETLPGINALSTTVNVWWCDSDGVTNCLSTETNAKPDNIVKVKVAYRFASVPFMSSQSLTLSSTSEMVIWK